MRRLTIEMWPREALRWSGVLLGGSGDGSVSVEGWLWMIRAQREAESRWMARWRRVPGGSIVHEESSVLVYVVVKEEVRHVGGDVLDGRVRGL
jgi:hypothetical protein